MVSKKDKKAAVIGSGVAGLAAALRLQIAGFQVSVFEANDYVGGKLRQFEQDGFRFDAGPSVFTMPEQVLDLVKLAGKGEDHFQYKKLEESCKFFWEDGTQLNAYTVKSKLEKEIKTKLGTDPKPFLKQLAKSDYILEKTKGVFLERSLHKLQTYFSKDFLPALFAIPKLQIFETMHNAHKRNVQHPKLIQILDRYATYNGSSPYKAPGILDVIPSVEADVGFPKGGMYSITKTIYDLAVDKGVEFHLSTAVASVQLTDKTADTIITKSGDTHSFDVVVSNADVVTTYKNLLPKEFSATKYEKQERSSSAVVFYWGVKGKFDKLGLHNAFFTENYKEEFEYIFDKKELYSDPTIYLNITSKHEPSDAPEGCENWFTMINVPANNGQDWNVIVNRAKKLILSKLSRILGTNIADHIISESIMNPIDIYERTGSHAGSIYGTASNDKMASFFRHPNFSSKIKNLYFCGGSAHPGAGVPVCLLSAKIVSEIIEDDHA